MKLKLLTLSCIFACTHLYAQKVELSFQANSGLFHYTGNGAESTTFLLPGQSADQYRANNPYGNKFAFSYGAGMQAQFVGKSGFITGLQGGFDILRSKAAVNSVYPSNVLNADFFNIAYVAYQVNANGKVFTQNNDININPYVGYRIKLKKIKIDLMPGVDLAYNVSSSENGKALASNGTTYKADYKLTKSPADVRLRFGVALSCSKLGFTASYAHGLTNYASNLDYNSGGMSSARVVRSELIRFGITYRIL